jgi:predicted homoserine dehydrogenase-like protein
MLANAGFETNVFTYAKHDLSAGELLDGIGDYHCYGLIENQAGQEAGEGLPICLSEQVVLKQDIKKDQRILLTDIDFDPERIDFRLYREAYRLGRVLPL